MSRTIYRFLAGAAVALTLAACSAPKYTVDDGRQVNEELLRNIRNFGAGEAALRPAIARTAQLNDPACSKQWELPFSVATSAAFNENERVAWVRGLNVDERLTIVGAAPGIGLDLGDKIERIDGRSSRDMEKMTAILMDRRDSGKPFPMQLASGKTVQVKPFEVCRGYTRLAPPGVPRLQEYHWLMSVHPLEAVQSAPTEDEALWMVLWTQGVSEEGGARMKAYHYGTKIAGTIYSLATLVSGVKGVAMAAETAVKTAQSAAANAASNLLRQQLLDQATAIARNQTREQLGVAFRQFGQQQAVTQMQLAAANRGALSGVSWIAGTVFDKADTWAWTRMETLGADPLAAFTLHQRLIEQGLYGNAFVFDMERLAGLSKVAESGGKGEDVVMILDGLRPDMLPLNLADMPLSSTPSSLGIFGDDTQAAARPPVFGFIDSMLEVPLEPITTR